MDTHTLEAFLAVAENGSFSGAAATLFVTQPAVSKRIAALEDELGLRLFERLGRRILLTEAGRVLLPQARLIIFEMKESKKLLIDLQKEISGILQMATSHHLGLHRLPDVLRAFTLAYPKVELDLLFTDSETGCERVLCGDLELAVITLPLNPDPKLTIEKCWDDPLMLMVSNQHPLARAMPTPEELCTYPALLPEIGTVTRHIIEAPFKAARLPLKIQVETNYLETIRMLVAVGMGWSILPQSMQTPQLQSYVLPGMHFSRELGVVTRTGRVLSRAAQAFCTLLRKNAHPR